MMTTQLISQCMHCNGIRQVDGSYQPHDVKLEEASHGICPKCMDTLPMYQDVKGKVKAWREAKDAGLL